MRSPTLFRLPPDTHWLLASALLLGLAHPPFRLLIPSFVALVPLYVWLERLPSGDSGRTVALRGGFLLGLVYHSLVFYWLFVALVFYTWLAALAFVLPVLIMSGFLALAVAAAHESRRHLRWPLWLALPLFWTAAEWLRAHLGPVSFPWMGLGDTLTGFPWLIGAADLVGSRGITLWLVLTNALLGRWVVHRMSGSRSGGMQGGERRLLLRLGVVVAVAGPPAYSAARWHTLEPQTAATVLVVQPNIPEDLKLRREAANRRAVETTDRLVATIADSADLDVDLVLMPETMLQTYLDYGEGRRYDAWVRNLARRLDAAVLVGGLGADVHPDGSYDYYNSAFLYQAGGERVGRYDKRYLVPVVERVPFVNPRWFRGLDYFGGFGVGRWQEPFRIGGARFGVLICYESIYEQLSRRNRVAGADFLVNVTNDAWFGRERPWWSRSSGLYQHPAHLVMRAVENRVGVARAANTGISGVVDPLGRWRQRTPLFEEEAFVARVETTSGRTVFSRFGDVPGGASALAAALAILLIGVRNRSRRCPAS